MTVRPTRRGAELVVRGRNGDLMGWMRFAALGRDAERATLGAAASPAVTLGALTFERDRGVTEWWRVADGAVEHGATLAERPPGEGSLVLEVAVEGGFRARTVDRDVVALEDAAGVARARYQHLVVRDAGGAFVPAHFTDTAAGIAIVLDDQGARYPLLVDPVVAAEEATLSVPGWDVTGRLGYAIAAAADGSRVVVGAPAEDTPYMGAALVLAWDGGEWRTEAVLVASDGQYEDACGASVAIDAAGQRVLVGCWDETSSGQLPRSARMFARSGSIWTEEAKIDSPTWNVPAWFGASVALDADGNRALIGEVSSTGGPSRAHVFVRSGTTWVAEAVLVASASANWDAFGATGALDAGGDRAIVGAQAGWAAMFRRIGATWGEEQILPAEAGFMAPVALDGVGSRALVGAPYAQSHGRVTAFVRSGSTWSQEAILVPANGALWDAFGWSTALTADGTRAIIGAAGDDGDTGTARAFVRTGSTWAEEATLATPLGEAGGMLGFSVATTADGTRAFAGAPYDRSMPGRLGIAWVFSRAGSSWAPEVKLRGAGAASEDGFGRAVAVSANGDRALVGAPGVDTEVAADAGAARVYVRSGATWTEEAVFPAPDAGAQDHFGAVVALSGDASRALVGRSDRAHVTVRAGSTWSQEATLPVPGATAWALSADGMRALAGAPDDATVNPHAGMANVFVRSGSTWTKEAKLLPPVTLFFASFGRAVALCEDGSRAAIGVPGDHSGSHRGTARIFARTGVGWVEEATLDAPDNPDGLGEAVALSASGDRALVGAPQDDPLLLAAAGTARVFRRSASTWELEATLSASNAAPNERFGRAVDLAADGGRAVILGRSGWYLFVRTGSIWTESAAELRVAGCSALSGDGSRLFLGSSYEGLPRAGKVHVLTLFETLGDPCSLDATCASGACVDGVCCDTPCGFGAPSDCIACSMAAGAPSDGTCAPRGAGVACSDANVCSASDACDGAGTCFGSAPVWCNDANVCTSDSCDATTGCLYAPLLDGSP
ncbi:MAG: hypothetical protein HY908_18110, partial [Myxococcales bacterium]|nr:hypothetical protein [Myxococcales bacterium]